MLASERTILTPSNVGPTEWQRIVFTLEGWASISSSRLQKPLMRGSVLTVPAGAMPRLRPYGLLRTVTVHVEPGYLAEQLRWLPHQHPLVHQLHRNLNDSSTLGRLELPSHTMDALTPALLRTARLSPLAGHEFALLAATSEVFDIVGRASGSTAFAGNADRRLPRKEIALASRLLHRYPDRHWTVDELAREVRLSSSQLTRAFRADLDVSPAAYLRQVRTDRLAELLSTTTIRVSEAARQAGWTNPTVAGRAFKHRCGVSPRSFAATHETTWHDAVA